MGHLAHKIVLGENRITLAGDPQLNTRWLTGHGAGFRALRRLDIQVSAVDTSAWMGNPKLIECWHQADAAANPAAPSPLPTRIAFRHLFGAIRDHACLPILALTLDEGSLRNVLYIDPRIRADAWHFGELGSLPRLLGRAGATRWHTPPQTPNGLAAGGARYRPALELAGEVRAAGLEQVRSFVALWPCLGDEFEAEMEKVVVRGGYASAAKRKVPVADRDPLGPHEKRCGT